MQENLKQLELLVTQAVQRLNTLQSEAAALRQKIRSQEETVARLKEGEAELKALREWKKTAVGALKKLQTRIDKELAKAKDRQDGPL